MTADQIGAHRPDAVRGWLVFDHLPPDLQIAEDSTLAADHERAAARHGRAFTRDATEAERILLAHIGFTELTDDLRTRVQWVASGVRKRTWPQLDGTTDPAPSAAPTVNVYLGGHTTGPTP